MTTVAVRILDSSGTLVLAPAVAGGYTLTGLSEGARSWRRADAASRFVDGSALVAATLDMSLANAVWLVRGSTAAQMQTRTDALRDALEQFTFQLEVTVDGVVEVWDCWCADTALGDGGQLESELQTTKTRRMTASIPRQPRPL